MPEMNSFVRVIFISYSMEYVLHIEIYCCFYCYSIRASLSPLQKKMKNEMLKKQVGWPMGV
jgi:hypothetical protein